MAYHHQYPEEIRAKAITRAVAALKRRLIYGHSGINSWEKGQNVIDPASARSVEEAPEDAGGGQD